MRSPRLGHAPADTTPVVHRPDVARAAHAVLDRGCRDGQRLRFTGGGVFGRIADLDLLLVGLRDPARVERGARREGASARRFWPVDSQADQWASRVLRRRFEEGVRRTGLGIDTPEIDDPTPRKP